MNTNSVELISHWGSDLMVVNAARVSFGKESLEFSEKDAKLIKYLKEHKHTSVFRHPQLQFRIKCPIFVERQIFKHQVGISANSISGRYADFSDEYWTPEVLRYQSKDSKQGSSRDLDVDKNEIYINKIKDHIESSKQLYKELEEEGVAKELCRIILPMCLQTQFIWTGSLLAILHMFSLRLKPDAQKETREIAEQMLNLMKNIPDKPFKHTLEAFGL